MADPCRPPDGPRRLWLIPIVLGGGGLVLAALVLTRFWNGPLMASLDHPDPVVRVAALRQSPSSVNILKALQDEDVDVRIVAAGYVRREDWAVRALIEALHDPHAGVRWQAAMSLQWIGPQAGPALCDALHDPDANVRALAAYALCEFSSGKDWDEDRPQHPPEQKQAIIRALSQALLKDDSSEVRRNAATALRRLQLETPEDIAAIEETLRLVEKDPNEEVRKAVEESWAGIQRRKAAKSAR